MSMKSLSVLFPFALASLAAGAVGCAAPSADDSGVERWTGILADVMREILALEDMHLVRQF